MKKVIIVLILILMVAAVVFMKKHRRQPTEKRYSEQETSFPASEVIATVDSRNITLVDLEAAWQRLPTQLRGAFERQKHEFLEELITRQLLLQEAKRLKEDETEEFQEIASTASGDPGRKEDALISFFIKEKVLGGIEVTEDEVKAFYEKHKDEIQGHPRFEDIKDQLRFSALQQKQYQEMEKYIANLKEKADIRRNAAWIEAQKARALDNPLDRALATGRPVVADFGRGVCIPCKMMKPILDDLAKKYQSKAEILIIEIDEYPGLTRRTGIRVIPTQIFYDASGREVYRHQGFMSKEAIEEQLDKLNVK